MNNGQVYDRAYWEKKSSLRILNMVNVIFDRLNDLLADCRLNPTSIYIGIAKRVI